MSRIFKYNYPPSISDTLWHNTSFLLCAHFLHQQVAILIVNCVIWSVATLSFFFILFCNVASTNCNRQRQIQVLTTVNSSSHSLELTELRPARFRMTGGGLLESRTQFPCVFPRVVQIFESLAIFYFETVCRSNKFDCNNNSNYVAENCFNFQPRVNSTLALDLFFKKEKKKIVW